jgi:hypothetical protein
MPFEDMLGCQKIHKESLQYETEIHAFYGDHQFNSFLMDRFWSNNPLNLA